MIVRLKNALSGKYKHTIYKYRRIEHEGVKLHLKEPICTIDQDAICEAIKDIMEGCKAAFLLRKKKYFL